MLIAHIYFIEGLIASENCYFTISNGPYFAYRHIHTHRESATWNMNAVWGWRQCEYKHDEKQQQCSFTQRILHYAAVRCCLICEFPGKTWNLHSMKFYHTFRISVLSLSLTISLSLSSSFLLVVCCGVDGGFLLYSPLSVFVSAFS